MKQKTSIFGNIEAYQVELSINCYLYYLYVPNKNGIIVISRANLSYSTNPYWTILDEVLSTFKFTNATGSAVSTPAAVACTLEAKICPDGSSVGRTGPNCEFAPCP